MGNIFNVENRFFQALNKIIDCLFISIVAMIFSLPMFTIGAVLSALYYTMHKQLIHNRGYVWSTFYGAFKSNFKNSTKTWLIQFALSLLLIGDVVICYHLMDAGNKYGLMIFVFAFLLICVLVWGIYCMCYFARFDQEPKVVRKNAFAISVINLPWSVLIGVILVGSVLCIYIIPITILFMPIATVSMYYLILEKVFHKYMSPEDIAKEAEDNRIDDIS